MPGIDLQKLIEHAMIYAKSSQNNGAVASYIPELSKANPCSLGVCVVANNKKMYTAGEYNTLFTMQSISKVVSLLMALEMLGEKKVFSLVGVEPTGDAFNSMIRLEAQTYIPFNPMINAGAIAVAGMLNNCYRFDNYLEFIGKLCGREDVHINETVYHSERATGMRNRAIAYFLANDGVLHNDVENIVDFYFKMCSVNVNCIDLARIGSVLANDGVDIFSGERLVQPQYATIVKTVMITCGLYDGSGTFATQVGIPSKSGVGGGIVSSVTANFGIGVYGPALDSKGNSTLGMRVLEYLSKELNLHSFSASPINEHY